MATYIIRRMLQGLVVLFISTLAIYTILIYTPGGPKDLIDRLKGESGGQVIINPELARLYTIQYGLDKPYPFGYLTWLFDPSDTTERLYYVEDGSLQVYSTTKGIDLFGIVKGSGVLTGDLSDSVIVDQGKPVIELMGARFGNTLILMGMSTLVSILIAIPIGIVAAIKQYSKLDYTVTAFSFVGLSMPTFWFGLMLIILLGILPRQLHNQGATWLPYLPTGDTGDSINPSFIDRIYHLILPVAVLSFVNVAGLSRYVRASMLEVLRQDYVRTAWAKGLHQRTVILKHALRNALIPVITIVTLGLPALFGGAIITETVFNYFGMGKLYFESVGQFDIPLVMGFLLINVTLIILANILADVLYAAADPRIRFS
ncbi:MAG TPA: ABC transporter permease [Chloroflexia bacterium]|nr:ABC transporter permease [Chloroflexia bacterium]